MRRLILAYPRSATTYTARMIQAHGLKFGHENRGDQTDGAISYFKIHYPCKFDVILHQVRDPLKTISSAVTVLAKRTHNEFYILFDIEKADREKSVLYRVMLTWLMLNELAEKGTEWRYRIEDIDKVYPELCQRLDIQPKEGFPSLDRRVNTRPHPMLAWNDLDKEDFALSQRIKEKAKQYGYDNGL
jgi:hypothetical protein